MNLIKLFFKLLQRNKTVKHSYKRFVLLKYKLLKYTIKTIVFETKCLFSMEINKHQIHIIIVV